MPKHLHFVCYVIFTHDTIHFYGTLLTLFGVNGRRRGLDFVRLVQEGISEIDADPLSQRNKRSRSGMKLGLCYIDAMYTTVSSVNLLEFVYNLMQAKIFKEIQKFG